MRALVLVFVSLLSGASCGRCDRGNSSPPAPSVLASTSGSAGGGNARCVAVSKPEIVGAAPGSAPTDDDAPVAYGAELGGAASEAAAFVLGIRTAGLTGKAEVLRLPHSGGAASVIATLPATGAAHAPVVASRNGVTVVATMSLADKSRVFHLSRIPTSGAPTKLFDVAQAKDESELTALLPTTSGALVAWDDVESGRGVIRLASAGTLSDGADAGALSDAGAGATAASPVTSDAAWPALIPTPDGARAILVWLSERPEDSDTDAAGEPSQSEAFRWVEAVVIDLATAKPIAATRALTPSSGHAQTFAAVWSDGLVIAVRDDPRPTDGDGGELHAYRVAVDASGALGEPAHATIAEKDVAPGVAAVLPRAGGGLISYLTHDGSAQLVPAFTGGVGSTEPVLKGRRVVATHERRSLTTRLAGSGLELLVVECN